MLAQGAGWLVAETHKRFGLSRALVPGWLGGGDRLETGAGVIWPQPIEHEEEPHQGDQQEFVEKQGRYHGHAPSDGGEMGHFIGFERD